jgi:hypothetical protein
MAILEMINAVFNSANDLLDFVFFWGGWLAFLEYPVVFLAKGVIRNAKEQRKKGSRSKLGDVFSETFILLLAAFALGIGWSLPDIILVWAASGWRTDPGLILNFPPELITAWTQSIWLLTYVRWAELAILLFGLAYYFGHQYGERRWFNSAVSHIGIVFVSMIFFGRWMGLFFIAIPVLVAYYFSLYNMAVILLPASNPEDRAEKWKRFVVFASYAWGIQLPMYVIDGHAWKKLEARIPGDFTWDYPVPGLIWTRSHQVVAITSGITFKRLDGPGVVFTGKMERPFQVFDLRLQLRTNEIDVVSKDGVTFKARVFTAFRLDPESWDKDLYDQLRPLNPLLRGADKPTYTLGSFPFSHLRIQATLGVTSTKASAGDSLIYWDQWVLSVVENTARKVLSQKNLDELWRPAKDEKFANALDAIANEIKENAYLTLRSAGILVLGARVVNFSFPGEQGQTDEISKQQIDTWGSEWDGKSSKILAEAKAESAYAQQEARAYAQSLLLDSIVQGLQKAQKMHPDLPRYIIAMRFLSAFQDFIRTQPGEQEFDEVQTYYMGLQEQIFPTPGREKKL